MALQAELRAGGAIISTVTLAELVVGARDAAAEARPSELHPASVV